MTKPRSANSTLSRRRTRSGPVLTIIGVSFFALLASACGSSASETQTTTPITTQNIPAVSAQADFPDLPATEAVTIEGEALPVLEQGDDPAVGLTAPTLNGSDLNGNPIEIMADGRPKAVYFVAHWCPHCQREVPVLQGLINDGKKPEGIDVYAVSTSVDETQANFPPSAWLAKEGFQPPTMRDDVDSSAYIAYGGGGFPYAVYLDGNNNVLRRTAGELGAEKILATWQETAAS